MSKLLTEIQHAEYRNLLQLDAAESLGLTVTAQALSDELTARFDDSELVTEDDISQYATLYTGSMLLSWLLGQYHILQMVAQPVTLANDDDAISNADLTFNEAIDFLRSQVPVDSTTYRDMEANLKLRGFTVAAVSSVHAAHDVQRMYETALKTGQTASEAKQNVNAYLNAAGVSPANPYYLELHYRNNMMTSYNAGRWTQIVDNDAVGFLVYVAVLDDGTTELCRHLDNIVKSKTDAFWQKYYPPNHHKCRSTVSPLAQAQYDQLSDEEQQASGAVSDHSIQQDSTMASEHQFKGSPVNAMATLPKSLMDQAQSFGLTSNILKYTQSVSGDVLASRNAELTTQPVSRSVINKAVEADPEMNPFSEMATNVPGNADEVRLGFETLYGEDPTLTIQYLQQADENTWLKASAPAYTEEGVLNATALSDEERRQVLNDTIPLTVENVTLQ